MLHSTIRLFTDHATGELVIMGQYPDNIWREVERCPADAPPATLAKIVAIELAWIESQGKGEAESHPQPQPQGGVL